MIKIILYTFVFLGLAGCSSSVMDAMEDRLYSVLPPPPPTGDPGLNNPIDPEINVPGLNLKTFIGGEYVKGSATVPRMVKWYLEPVDPNDEGLYSTKIEYSKDDGKTWTVIAASVPSIGSKLMEYPWIVGDAQDWEGQYYKLRLTTTNVYGSQYKKETVGNFTVDNTAPTLVTDSMTVNSVPTPFTPGQGYGRIVVNRTFMAVGFSASDKLSPVNGFCVKIGSASPPKSDDECWRPFSLVDVEPAKDVVVPAVPAFVGFVPSNFNAFLWVQDQAGNISSLTQGAGVYNTDKAQVEFRPVKVPEIKRFVVSNTVTPSTPPTRDQLEIKPGDSVVIKWYAKPGGNSEYASKNPFILEYADDEAETYKPVTDQTILNGNNSNCFAPGDQSNDPTKENLYSACYVWSGSNIPTGYFKVRLKVTNDVGLVATVSSAPLNSGAFRNVAGNTDNSMGSSAETTIFNYSYCDGCVSPGSMVVTSWGRIFVRDTRYGVVSIDPADGLAKVYVKQGVNCGNLNTPQPGEGLDVSKAATCPLRIALDYKDRLLILERNRVRRVAKDGIIETIIGVKPPDARNPEDKTGYKPFADSGLIAPKSTDDVKANWFEKTATGEYKNLTPEGCFKTSGVKGIRAQFYEFDARNTNNAFIWPLPNGDIYFSSSNSWDGVIQSPVDSAPYVAVYMEKDYRGRPVDRVYPIRFCGKGAFDNSLNQQQPYMDHVTYNLRVRATPGLLFNPVNSYVESLSFRATQPLNSGDEKPFGVTFNPRSGKSRGANTIYPNAIGKWGLGSYFPGRRGELFAQHYGAGVVKYNPSLNIWEPVFRGGVGQCFDGTKAADCYVDMVDYFQTIDNIPYFYDKGRIRAVSNQKVLTLFGESRSAGNGGSPGTARLNMVEYFGVYGAGANKKILLYDTNERMMRDIQPGSMISHVMGNDGQGRCVKDPSTGICSYDTGYFYWGTPNSKISNTFDASTKAGSLDMKASVFRPEYWNWSTGFVVDPDNGDVYSYSTGGPRHGIARFFKDKNDGNYKGQMVLGNYLGGNQRFLTKGAASCDNTSAFKCDITTLDRPYWAWTYAVVVPTMGLDFKTKKKTILATTHDWSYTSRDPNTGIFSGSHRQCYMKAIRLPALETDGGGARVDGTPIPATNLSKLPTAADGVKGSLVQHMIGADGECAGYAGTTEAIPETPGTNMGNNLNFPSWHSTTIPHRMVAEEDSVFMSWRGSSKIFKIDYVRSSVASLGSDVITGSTMNAIAADTGVSLRAFNYRKTSAGYEFYACAGDGNLYQFKPSGSNGVVTRTLLPLPKGSGIRCADRGKSIEWSDDEKTSFYFVYVQNGLNAIGEYYVGP